MESFLSPALLIDAHVSDETWKNVLIFRSVPKPMICGHQKTKIRELQKFVCKRQCIATAGRHLPGSPVDDLWMKTIDVARGRDRDHQLLLCILFGVGYIYISFSFSCWLLRPHGGTGRWSTLFRPFIESSCLGTCGFFVLPCRHRCCNCSDGKKERKLSWIFVFL